MNEDYYFIGSMIPTNDSAIFMLIRPTGQLPYISKNKDSDFLASAGYNTAKYRYNKEKDKGTLFKVEDDRFEKDCRDYPEVVVMSDELYAEVIKTIEAGNFID